MKKSDLKRFSKYLDTAFPRGAGNSQGELKGKTQQEQMDILLDRLETPEQRERSQRGFDILSGRIPLKETPPDDMPALKKIKIYARSGYNLHHIGTDEDFERVWEEAFKKESKVKFLVDSQHQKGGRK